MSDFHNERLSPKISYGATGGPRRKTEIVELHSGFEERNTPWSRSRRSYDIGYGIRSTDDVYDVVEFFEAREGALFGFRYKDWTDYKSTKPLPENVITPTDQSIAVGDGTSTQFQLIKAYADGSGSYIRTIDKPVTDSVVVAIDGQAIDSTDFYVSPHSGIIALMIIPEDEAIVTAGYEFDIPVRFESDELRVNLANYEKGEIANISIIEVRTTPPPTESAESLQEAAMWRWVQANDINTSVNTHWTSTWGIE